MFDRDTIGENEAEGLPVDFGDRLWLDVTQSLAKESINSIESAAKQVIGITSALQAIYFAVVSLADLRKTIRSMSNPGRWLTAAVFLTPALFWMLSLAFAAWSFTPKAYRTNLKSPDLAQKFYANMAHYKHRQLVRAYWALLIGFLSVLASAFGYLYFMPIK
jgi:hypothetical protein